MQEKDDWVMVVSIDDVMADKEELSAMEAKTSELAIFWKHVKRDTAAKKLLIYLMYNLSPPPL